MGKMRQHLHILYADTSVFCNLPAMSLTWSSQPGQGGLEAQLGLCRIGQVGFTSFPTPNPTPFFPHIQGKEAAGSSPYCCIFFLYLYLRHLDRLSGSETGLVGKPGETRPTSIPALPRLRKGPSAKAPGQKVKGVLGPCVPTLHGNNSKAFGDQV